MPGVSLMLGALAGWAVAPVCGAEERVVLQLMGETMGSYYTVKLVDCTLSDDALERLRNALDRRLDELNRQLSHYRADSELSAFGRAPAGAPFKVSPEFAEVLRAALDLHQRSEGLFDPTIGPLIDLWGFGPKGRRQAPPTEAEIDAARQRVGAGHLRLTRQNELVKDIPELQLNLGSVTKGYGARDMARILQAHQLTNYYVAISGEVYVHGRGPAGPEWRIGIDEPEFDALPGDKIHIVVRLTNAAISTSGNYRQYFRDRNHQVYAHIVDPRTGRPTTNRLASVTVITPDSEVADGMATTAYLLGLEGGLRFIESSTNASALFIERQDDGTFRRVASRRFPQYELQNH